MARKPAKSKAQGKAKKTTTPKKSRRTKRRSSGGSFMLDNISTPIN